MTVVLIPSPNSCGPSTSRRRQLLTSAEVEALAIENEQVARKLLEAYNTARPGCVEVTYSDLMQQKRGNAEIALARQLVMYILAEHCDRSLPHVGLFLGGRDHSTVLHGRDHVQELLGKPEKSEFLSSVIKDALERITGPASPAASAT